MHYLRKSKHNIMIQKSLHNADINIFHNLYTMICAILDISKNRDHNPTLDDKVLQSYIDEKEFNQNNIKKTLVD